MENLNRIELKGRIGQGARVACVGDSKVAHFSMFTSVFLKDGNGDCKEETTWHSIAAWDGDNICDFDGLKSGVFVHIVGRLCIKKYVTVEGEERCYPEIVASELRIIPEQ